MSSPATAVARREAAQATVASITKLGQAASRVHAAMVRATSPHRCERLRAARAVAVQAYAQALLARLEDRLTAATAREVFASAAGISRARWVAAAEQHRAQALLKRAGAQLWRSTPATHGARLKRVQDAAAWVLQLPPSDPTVRAWRRESSLLAAHHAKLRAARLAQPFAAALQNKLVRELGGASHPTARRWLATVVRDSSLRFDIRSTGRCADSAARIRAALSSPFGVRVPLELRLTACGPRAPGDAMRVLIGHGKLTPRGGAAIVVPLALGAKPPPAAAAANAATPPQLTGAASSRNAAGQTPAAIDAQLCAAAAKRLRRRAAPVRMRLAQAEIATARRTKAPLQAEEHWLRALAWAGELPADGAAFLAKHLSLTVAQARAAQSLRWTRPRLLLRMPTRPYPAGRPHACPDQK